MMLQTQGVSRRELLFGSVCLASAGGVVRGQAGPAGTPTFAAGVKVVNIFATVRDKKGRIIKDLQKEDFLLEEDGRAQTIGYFASQSDLPLVLGLVVDTSESEARMLPEERSACRKFLERVLRPETDKAFLIQFSTEVELIQELTPSREKLEKALDLLGSPEEGTARPRREEFHWQGGQAPAGGGGGRRGGPPGRGGSSVLCDAVYLASAEVLQREQGRKAIILIADGDDGGSKVTQAEAVTAATRADTLIYSIRIYDKNFGGGRRGGTFSIPGIGFPGGGGGGRMGGPGGGGGGNPPGGGRGPGDQDDRKDWEKRLKEISAATGGGYFDATGRQPLEKIFETIDEELRNQYSLGYTPLEGMKPGYHKIKLSARRKDLVVRAREGYYAEA